MTDKIQIYSQRLPIHPDEQIDRRQVINFRFNGRIYPAHPGDTIASALAAAKIHAFHPNAPLCYTSNCTHCQVTINSQPNIILACQHPVTPNLKVETHHNQHASPQKQPPCPPFIHPFQHNHTTGILLAPAIQQLTRLYSIYPGETAVIITNNNHGWHTATTLHQANIQITAIADERLIIPPTIKTVCPRNVPIYLGHTILAATGNKQVEAAILAPVNEHGELSTAAQQTITCDLIVISSR